MNTNTNTNTTENTRNNIIPHDSTSRGYSVHNSFYDSPYNMDFEYGYLNLIVNISSFIARTQDMFLNLESNLSNIIELQSERRRRHLEAREARETNENSNTSQPAPLPASSRPTTSYTTNTPPPPPQPLPPLPNNNLNSIFGTRNVFLGLNPSTLYNNSPNLGQSANRSIRRNRDGLTIQEIEENTEIVNYDSIDADQILNTECPISRDVFNSTSIVLRLKECRHCFVPFRIMTWLESHSTCPLCRCVVAPAAAAAAPAPTTTFSNIINNIRNNSNLDNLSIDNINDDSFVFSFDMPRPTINAAQGQDVTNAYLSTLSQLFSNTNNTRARQNNETSDAAANTADTGANTESNETNNVYDEVD